MEKMRTALSDFLKHYCVWYDYWVFSQFICVCFIICKKFKVLFVLVQQTSDFVASLGWAWAGYRLPDLAIHCFFSWLALLFLKISFIYDVRVRGVVLMFNETHSFFVWGSS